MPANRLIYRIVGYFRREFIFGYFKEAFLFENKFWLTAFLQKLISIQQLTASREDYSASDCACVMAYRSSRLQTLESGIQWPAHQKSL